MCYGLLEPLLSAIQRCFALRRVTAASATSLHQEHCAKARKTECSIELFDMGQKPLECAGER